MFGNKDKSASADITAPVKTSSKDIKTLIGEGCKVEGNFYIPTFTRVDGTIKGDLNGESGIIIGTSGNVIGNIFASEVVIYGEVQGKVECLKLELKKGSTLNGDIVVSNLITENGCTFNGRCTMNESVQQNVKELSESIQTA